jgi:hypothetical protein
VTPLELVLSRLEGVKRSGDGWTARCPAHHDRAPSLSIGEADDERVLLKCFAGCETEAIVAAVDLTVAELFPADSNDFGEPQEVYPYVDEWSQLLFEVCRFPGKRFLQRRPDSAVPGGFVWKLGKTRRVLYRTDRLFSEREQHPQGPVYICEGERDVHALEAAGALATCNPMGAGKWRPEYAEQLAGFFHVIVVADNDGPGRKHAREVAASLANVVDLVEVVRATEGKDASDHLAAGHGLEDFVPLEPEEAALDDELHSWIPVDLLAAGSNPPEPPFVAGVLYGYRSHLVSGETEAVKTWLALIFCAELIGAGVSVVYIDYENGPAEILSRLRLLGVPDESIAERFTYFHPDEGIAHEPAMMRDLLALLAKREPALGIVDAWIGALQTHDLDPNIGVEIERWRRTFLEPLRSVCPATLILDHVPKAQDSRGRYSIGSERKASAVEVHLGAEVLVPFARGKTGRIKLTTHKDRGGWLPRPRAAELELRSDPETLAITWDFNLSEHASDEGEIFRPTVLMERVSRYLERQAAPVKRTTITEDVTGNRQFELKAINALIREGFAIEEPDGGIVSLKLFREADDDA